MLSFISAHETWDQNTGKINTLRVLDEQSQYHSGDALHSCTPKRLVSHDFQFQHGLELHVCQEFNKM